MLHDYELFSLFDRRSEVLTRAGRPFARFFTSGCSSEWSRCRDERVVYCRWGPGSELAAFAARFAKFCLVAISVEHRPLFVTPEPTEDMRVSVPGWFDGGSVLTVWGSSKRGSIFVISKPTEEAGVSVLDRASDSEDTSELSTDVMARQTGRDSSGRWQSLILTSYVCTLAAWARNSVTLANFGTWL